MMRIALFLLTNLAVMVVFGLVLSLTGIQSSSVQGLMIMALLFGFGGSFVSLLMSKWMALRSVGGEVIEQPRNERERWLVNTVATQARQAGIAMPQVAIYHAPDINAFATGARRDASLVAVSTGLLQNMSPDEAEAVIAHEISHIANGDMVTMTLIQGVVNTFVIFISRILAQLAAGFMGGNRDEGEESNGNPLIYFAVATVLELVFGILASIITMWFSRHREFHADAGSAKLVGREKMIAALQRLKTSYEPQEATSMMAFCIIIPADWQSRLPNNSSPFYSTMGFLVRKGNPKNIHDWNDLVRSDVKLIFPNPKTSGNARYTYLAAWGAADKADGGDKAKTEQFMTQFLKNVEVFDTGGRGATTTFAERGLGDVLISFESEVNNIRKQYEAQGFEVVIPKTNILAEFPVAWVDKNVQANGTEKAAKAYLNWLYSPQAQTIITDYYYRVNNPEVMDKLKNKFPQTELFRVEDKFGSWPEVMKTHFTSGGELDKLLAAGRN